MLLQNQHREIHIQGLKGAVILWLQGRENSRNETPLTKYGLEYPETVEIQNDTYAGIQCMQLLVPLHRSM